MSDSSNENEPLLGTPLEGGIYHTFHGRPKGIPKNIVRFSSCCIYFSVLCFVFLLVLVAYVSLGWNFMSDAWDEHQKTHQLSDVELRTFFAVEDSANLLFGAIRQILTENGQLDLEPK